MRTGLIIAVALLAPLFFPAPFAFAIVCIAAVMVPPVGLVAGVLADAVYYAPHIPVLYGTLLGLVVTLTGYVVHHIIKTRIIEA